MANPNEPYYNPKNGVPLRDQVKQRLKSAGKRSASAPGIVGKSVRAAGKGLGYLTLLDLGQAAGRAGYDVYNMTPEQRNEAGGAVSAFLDKAGDYSLLLGGESQPAEKVPQQDRQSVALGNVQYSIPDNRPTISVADEQGGVAELSFESPASIAEAQKQIAERYPGATPGQGGTLTVVPAFDPKKAKAQADVEVLQAANAALDRGENIDIDRVMGFVEGGQAAQDPTAARIAEIQKELSRPIRGLRQSFGDMLAENRRRKELQAELDSLLKEQGQNQRAVAKRQMDLLNAARAQANADRNFALNLARFDRESRQQALRQIADSAKQMFPDDPERQILYQAKFEAASNPRKFFTTPRGLEARRVAKQRLIEGIRNERGLWDWFKSKFFNGRTPTQADIENLSFKDIVQGKGEMLLPEWISPNDVFVLGPNAYVYKDNLDPETRWVIEQLIAADTEGKTKSVRRGQ